MAETQRDSYINGHKGTFTGYQDLRLVCSTGTSYVILGRIVKPKRSFTVVLEANRQRYLTDH
jgi:hypothetical protein